MIVPGYGRQSRKEIRTFGTMPDDSLGLADWLVAEGLTHVAMESTGVFWKPLFNLLEDRFQLLLVNARDIKQVPGRKADVKDCEWIGDLLRHGLLKASLAPDRPRWATLTTQSSNAHLTHQEKDGRIAFTRALQRVRTTLATGDETWTGNRRVPRKLPAPIRRRCARRN
jgi:hypothetical protein